VDLSGCKALRKLTLIGIDTYREILDGINIKMPRHLSQLTVRRFWYQIDLGLCTELVHLEMEHCAIIPYQWAPPATLKHVEFKKFCFNNELIVNATFLKLIDCESVSNVPTSLNARTLDVRNTKWRVFPTLPYVNNLSVNEQEETTIRAEDILRCSHLKLSTRTRLNLDVFKNLTVLWLEKTTTVGALPRMLNLIELRLRYSPGLTLPPYAPQLTELIICDAVGILIIPEYESLRSLSVKRCMDGIWIANLPKLKKLILECRFPQTFTAQELPELLMLHVKNKNVRDLDAFMVGPLNPPPTGIIEIAERCNTLILNGFELNDERLLQAENISIHNCTFPDDTRFVSRANSVCMEFCANVPSLNVFARVPVIAVDDCQFRPDTMLEPLELHNVRSLCLRDEMTTLATLPQGPVCYQYLTTLALETTTLRSLDFLAGHNVLETLHINTSLVSTLAPLASIRTLNELHARYCSHIIDASPVAHLHIVDLSFCVNLRIVRALARVEDLTLQDCPMVSNADLLFLKHRL
jgi:hypothetical protein